MRLKLAHILPRCLFTSCLALMWTIMAFAQSNPFKINDRLYPIYVKASAQKTSLRGLALADSLMREARHLGDKKAQCLALVIPVQYHFSHDNEENMERAVKQLMALSKKTGYTQYYYYAASTMVGFLLNHMRQDRALDYANSLRDEAVRTADKYGILMSIRTLGYIHTNRNEHILAIKKYLEAVDYAKANGLDSELAQLYGNLALSYLSAMNSQKAIEYASKALGTNKSPTSYADYRAIIVLCKAYYDIADYDNFLKYYEILRKDKRFSTMDDATRIPLEIRYHLFWHEFDMVERLIRRLKNKRHKYYFTSILYRKCDKFEKALAAAETYANYEDTIHRQLAQERLVSYDASIAKYVLDERMRSSELELTNLKIANSELELDRLNRELLAARMAARTDSLEAQSEELEAQKSRTELEKMRIAHIKAEDDARHSRIRLIIYVSAVTIGLTIILLIIIGRIRATHRLRITNTKLSKRNEALDEARRRAEEADNMKTVFLQTMSHEIRTPLNAIVGFSQIISESGSELDEEERADFARRIELNSELVEQMINDILELTSIESGHYRMKLAPAPVNDMCRDAIAGNHHAIQPGVEMRFTTDLPDDFTATTDRRRTVEVLVNMLSNAVKNTSAGRVELHCTTAAQPGMLTFTVADTGCGVPAEMAEKIFDRFFKVDEFVQGVGLGLTICRTIAEHLDGRIYLDTAHSPGARFVFEIPLQNSSHRRQQNADGQ